MPLPAAGSSPSGSAWLGRSQKDGLPSRWRAFHWRLWLEAINSRTGEGQPGCCPFQIESDMDPKTIRGLVFLAALSLFCSTVAWATEHAVFSSVFLRLVPSP